MNEIMLLKENLSSLCVDDGCETSQECTHFAFINNKCTNCKKLKKRCYGVTTLLFPYLDCDLSLSIDGISCLRNLKLQNLLKDKKLQLVVDLDNTLIHTINSSHKNKRNYHKRVSSHKNNKKNAKNKQAIKNDKRKESKDDEDDVYETFKGETLVKLRPGGRNFLEKASQLFDLLIYTMADKPYARQIAKLLESDTVGFSWVISREDCTKMHTKGLDVVLSHQRMVLIVDDLDQVWREEDRGNIIKIKPYTYFNTEGSSGCSEGGGCGDQELARVLSVLKEVHTKFYDKKIRNCYDDKDVRQLLKKS